MNDNLLEKTVLFSSLNLQFLDFVDEMYENGDVCTQKCVDSFFDKKTFSYENVRKQIFSSLPTSLGLLTSIIFYIRIESHEGKEIEIEDYNGIEYFENNKRKDFSTEKILRTIRNSIAHNNESNSENILTESDKVIFRQEYRGNVYEVKFSTTSFHKFIMWMIKKSREIAGKNLT